jgi:hypothetical protein
VESLIKEGAEFMTMQDALKAGRGLIYWYFNLLMYYLS